MRKGSFIGIDFGTTNTSVVQVLSDEHGIKVNFLGEGVEPFPSIIAVPRNGGAAKFGREVRQSREELRSAGYDIFTSMKSGLGSDEEFVIGGKRCTATTITALFLTYVKKYISRNYNIEINEAGFSFPNDFPLEARRELQNAAKQAGIEVRCFISESTAAYIANRAEAKGSERVMVLDWGGGTFDISILNLSKTRVSETSVIGERLGGDDIDNELARRMHSIIARKDMKIGFDEINPADRDLMIAKCERAKIEISENDEDYDLTFMNYAGYGAKTETISLELFDGIVTPMIKDRILKAINAALGQNKLTPAGIDSVIIVGGSSNLTPYERIITGLFGSDKIILPEKPQWSTAKGAALMQITDGKFKLSDSLGVLLSDGSVFPILKSDEHGVGSSVGPLIFSLTEDTSEAHFIFTNGDGSKVFSKARTSVPVKGYLNERLELTAKIGHDQIASVSIHNPAMGNEASNRQRNLDINELTFFYDVSALDGANEI